MGIDMYILGVKHTHKKTVIEGYTRYISFTEELANFKSEYSLHEEIVRTCRDSMNVDILKDNINEGRFHVRINFGNLEPLASCLREYKKVRGNFYSDLNRKIMKSYISKINKWLKNNAKDGGRIEYYASYY